MTDDTTIASIMHADQADAATDRLAAQIARFYQGVAASGMPDETAAIIAESFATMATAQHFGIDVADPLGLGAMMDMED